MDNSKSLEDKRNELVAKIKRIEGLSQEIGDLAKTNRRGLLLISQKMKKIESLIYETDLVTPEILKERSPLNFRIITDDADEVFKCTYSDFLKDLKAYPPGWENKEYYISELMEKGEVLVGVRSYYLRV
jgi:hypothetical protein